MKSSIYISLFAFAALALTGCETATDNSNARTNSNTSVVKTSPTPSATPRRDNANVSKEEYEKNRSDYEKEKGSSTIGQGVNDSWLWFKTRAALASAEDLRESTINVDVVNDAVTLKGTVANPAQKLKAEQIAKGIEGVKGVKNELKVAAKDSLSNQMVNSKPDNKPVNANRK